MRKPSYDKDAVIADIAERKLKPIEIADKHGITIGNFYTIKANAKRAGLINSRGYKTLDERIKDENNVLTPELRERIKDLREAELSSSEIVEVLAKERHLVTFEDVCKVMARGASDMNLGKQLGKNRG